MTRLCYLLFLVTLPLVRPALVTVAGQPVQVSDLFLVLTYASLAAELPTRRRSFSSGRLFAAAAVYVAVLAVTILAAKGVRPASFAKLAAYGALVLLPWLSVQILGDEASARRAVRAWQWGSLIPIGVGLVSLVLFYVMRAWTESHLLCGYGGLPSGNYPRVCSTFRHSNMLASYLAVAMPLRIATLVEARRRWLPWVVLAIGGTVAAFTVSAQLGGLAIAAAFALAPLRRGAASRWLFRLAAAGAVVAALFLAAASVVRVVPRGQGDVTIGSRGIALFEGQRPIIWRGVIPNVKQHPLFGLGYGSLVSVTTDSRAWTAPDRLGPSPAPAPPTWLEGHDVWLSVLGQAGIVGLLAFAWLLYEIVRGARAALATTDPLRPWLVTLLGVFIGMFLYGGLFAAIEEARHVWAAFGLLAASIQYLRASSQRQAVASSG